MPDVAKSAYDMISGMSPALRPERFVFVTTQDLDVAHKLGLHAISVFREDEGVSLILPVEVADAAGHDITHPMCCITLNVFSSLEGVGLTAAVASALAANDIPCNMVAAFHHDHVFVPAHASDHAMQILKSLQSETAG